MIDIRKLKELVRLMVENDLSEIDLRDSEEQVTMRRLQGQAMPTVMHMPTSMVPTAPVTAPAPTSPAPRPAAASVDGAEDQAGLIRIDLIPYRLAILGRERLEDERHVGRVHRA